MRFPDPKFRMNNKGVAKFAIYILIFSALAVYSIFFVKDIVFAISYYPVAGNLCIYRSSSANDCTTNSATYNCASGTYIPSFGCTATGPSCTIETGSSSCNGACTDCNGAGSCVSKTCAAGNNYACPSGSYCNATPSCVATVANGQSCTCSGSPLNGACTSGNCQNGGASVCCDAGYQCCSVDGDCAANTFCSSNDCKFAYPQWSNNVTSVLSPYNTSISSFNVTWTQTNFSVSVVFFESNYTGTATNYTMTQLATNVYNYNLTLPTGTFYWKSWANSSKNTWNNTPQFIITVAKGVLLGSIFGSDEVYPNPVNITPSRSTPGGDADVNYTFWRNTSVNGGALVSSSVGSSPSADTSLLPAAKYSWILNSTGGANWTSNISISIKSFTVSQQLTPINVKYRLSFSINSTKASDNETTGNYNENIDSLSVSRFFYASDTNLAHAFTCAWDSFYNPNQLLSLIHSYQRSSLNYINFTTNPANPYYMMELSQKIAGSSLLIAYTQGSCDTINNNMYLVESNTIPTQAFASLSFGIPKESPLLMRVTYDRIALNGSDIFGAGINNLCVSKDSIAASNYPFITVKRC